MRALITRYGLRLAQPGPFDLVLPAAWRSPQDYARAAFRTQWVAFLDRLIEARRATHTDPEAPRDLFDLLDGARDPQTGEGFTHAQLRDEVSTMILAGHETTAVTLFWCLYLAALYPEAQEVLADEAADGLDAAALPLTRAHVDEALRLYPPAFLIVREAIARRRDRRAGGGTGDSGDDLALGAAPPSAALGGPGRVRSGALPARGAACGPVCLHALRRRAAHLRRRQFRADRGRCWC